MSTQLTTPAIAVGAVVRIKSGVPPYQAHYVGQTGPVRHIIGTLTGVYAVVCLGGTTTAFRIGEVEVL